MLARPYQPVFAVPYATTLRAVRRAKALAAPHLDAQTAPKAQYPLQTY